MSVYFQTKRLDVRPLSMDDLDAFAEMESDPDVVKYTAYDPVDREQAETDLEFCIENHAMIDPVKLIYAVCGKEDDEFIGTCALVPMKPQQMEIGYRFRKRYWGNGYASELLPGLMEWALARPDIDVLYAEADVLNKASVKMLEKHMVFQREVYNAELSCVDRQYIYPSN